MAKKFGRMLKRWIFIKVNNPDPSILTEYNETGTIKLTPRRRINTWIMRKLMGPHGIEEFSPAPRDELELGSISWSFVDCVTGEMTAFTESIPMLSESQISIVKEGGINGEMQTKTICLSDRFCLKLHDSRLESVKEGFALNAGESDPMSFGWEWFLVDSADHATKLQETGELELTFANPKDQIDIIGCKFLTDISLRFSSHEYSMNRSHENMLSESGHGYDPQYRLVVKAGSYVNWPILVDGVVQMPK